MARKLRAGVIGLGHLGREHARIYADLPAVELVALCDVEESTRGQLPGRIAQKPFFRDPVAILEQVDLVSIATPSSTHVDVAMPFAERGIPILVEKPIATAIDKAEILIQAAERAGSLIQVGHVEEFNPALEASRSLIRRPRFVEVHRLAAFSGRSLDIDVVCDLMIHDLDLILSFVGMEIRMLHAVGVPVLSSQTDMASVRMEFVGGIIANLTASRASLKAQRRMRFFMSDRYLCVDFLERTAECLERRVEPGGDVVLEAVPVSVVKTEPLRREIESFVASVRTNSPPRVDGRRALRALTLALNIKAQIEERRLAAGPP